VKLVRSRCSTWEATFIDEVYLPKNQKLKGRSIAEVAKEQGKHPIDVMLDISVEEDLKGRVCDGRLHQQR
jgi:N-acyl-D-aspartate/D-glutamate deacylase